jgi:hypothetical protein
MNNTGPILGMFFIALFIMHTIIEVGLYKTIKDLRKGNQMLCGFIDQLQSNNPAPVKDGQVKEGQS